MISKLILSTLIVLSVSLTNLNYNIQPQNAFANPFSISSLNNVKPSNIQSVQLNSPIIQAPTVPCIQVQPVSVASKLGANNAALNFSFPTDKLTQAGSVFQTTSPIITTSTVSTANTYSNSSFGGFSSNYKSEMASLIANIKDLNTT